MRKSKNLSRVQILPTEVYGQCKRIGTNENQIQRTERKVQTFLEALEHFPEVAKLLPKSGSNFFFKEAQERAEKKQGKKERQERIKARKSKRGMER